MSLRKLAVGVAFLAFLVMSLAHRTPAQTKKNETPAPAADTAYLQLSGSASCGGRACHGGSQPENKPIQQNEYSTWLIHDKHTEAYTALLSDRGKRIGANLGVVAHEDARCLACHTNPVLATSSLPKNLLPLRAEGIGCEACHGPANASPSWLAAHTTEAWKNNANRRGEFAKHSMTFISDPAVQVKVCAGCHVGAGPENGLPARDLNHDLMAAGHPRLNFELTVFRMNQPPHWRADKYKDDPAQEARLWAIGQVGAARASLELLAHRAEQAATAKAPWPEFAETDCFACHADLREKSWRQNKDYYKGRTPGNLPYSKWFSAMLPVVEPFATDAVKQLDADYTTLAKTMSRPAPDTKVVVQQARAGIEHADKLLTALASVKIDAGLVQSALEKARAHKNAIKEWRWEETEQLALALVALHQADRGFKKQPRDEKLAGLLTDLFKELSYPTGYESPKSYHRGEALQKALDAVLAGQ